MTDLNADWKCDIVITDFNTNLVSRLLGDGNASFAASVGYPVMSGMQVRAADMNGDAKLDLVTSAWNGDGKVDVAVATGLNDDVRVLLNAGGGAFAEKVDYPVGSWPSALAAGDLNGDGSADLAVANCNDRTVSVLFNNGNGTFAAKVVVAQGALPGSIAMGDVNGDGTLDLALTSQTDADVPVRDANEQHAPTPGNRAARRRGGPRARDARRAVGARGVRHRSTSGACRSSDRPREKSGQTSGPLRGDETSLVSMGLRPGPRARFAVAWS